MHMVSRIKRNRWLLLLIGLFILLVVAGKLSSQWLPAQMAVKGLSEGRNQIQPKIESGPIASPEMKAIMPDSEGTMAEPSVGSQDFAGQTIVGNLPPLGDKIIKTGSLTLRVKKGRFDRAYEQVIMLVQGSGGYIAGSTSASGQDRLISGTLTIKVPSKRFESIVAKLRHLGKLTNVNISSQDVSTEFVDLESRLRHWRAQETIMLKLMDKADSISDSITIQQQLSQIQMQIEQITGRIDYLKDQTSFSSLQVTLTEPGALPGYMDRWGFKTAVNQSAHAFVDTVNGLILLVGYLSPLVLIAGLAVLIWFSWRRRMVAV